MTTNQSEQMPGNIMAVTLTEWLYELFCEGQNIDMQDVQDKMVDIGIIEGIEATTEDIDNGFDENDIVFHKSAAYKNELDKVRADLVEKMKEGK